MKIYEVHGKTIRSDGAVAEYTERFTQPRLRRLHARLYHFYDMRCYKLPGFTKLEKYLERRHEKKCNNDCDEGMVWRRDRDGDSLERVGQWEKFCGYTPLGPSQDIKCHFLSMKGRVQVSRETGPFTLSLEARASNVCRAAHEGQVDKVGEPYFGHPYRVARAVKAAGFPEEAVAVAYLHDVVEDTAVTLTTLRALSFPEEVVEAVDAISKRKGEKFEDYYDRVKANDLALAVKWHDVADNSSPERLGQVAPDTQDRLRAKYERARELLGGPR